MKLFCLTHAGGTVDFYKELKDTDNLNNFLIIPLEYSGHGSRRLEVSYKNFNEITADMINLIKQNNSGNEAYAIMGYSMGCIVVAEIVQSLIQSKCIELPQHVFLAAHSPSPKKELTKINEYTSDDYIKQCTIMLGGIPKILFDNNVFWRMYLPLYKNDFHLILSYDFEQMNFKTDISATIFYSEEDTPYSEVCGWDKYFIGTNFYFGFEGNHFFIKDHYDEISEIIRNVLIL